MPSHHWTCSKFADWLRGTPTLKCGTAEQWDEWEDRAKQYNPVRYWLAEEGLGYLEKFVFYVPDTLHSIKYYINNRWITRTHALTANPRDIKPGTWRDVGDRFLPCLFNELQDFVEVELAWWHLMWADKEERAKYNAPWWRFGWWNIRIWRCAQAGLDNLEWQRKLVYDDDWMDSEDPYYGKPTPQAIRAQEILDLYNWWTKVYRNRPDPMDASGWSEYCDRKSNEDGGSFTGFLKETKNPELKEFGDKALKSCHEIEAAYEAEDTEMLIRLIKVRGGLWT